MAKELTDNRLEKIKVGFKSEFLGHVAKNQERIFISGGLFVQLGIRCHQFRYIYRTSDGKAKQMTIGRYNAQGDGKDSFTIDQAKSVYNQIMDKRKSGIDPQTLRREQKQKEEIEKKRKETLFGTYSLQWLNKRFESNEVTSPSHKAKLISYFTKTLSIINNTPLIDISGDTIREIFDSLLALSDNQQDKIHRISQLLRHLFKDAVREKLIDSNPMYGISPDDYPAPKRGKYAHIKDLPTLYRFLKLLPNIKGEPSTKAICQIAPHWFTRPVEIRLLKWEDVDFENNKCSLHKAKTKGQSINDGNVDLRPTDYFMPLSPQVKIILEQLHNITGTKTYVFAGINGDEPVSDNTAGKAMRKACKEAGYENLSTMHGFRYTGRGFLPGILGVSERVVEQHMAHNPDINGNEAAASNDKYGYDQYLYAAERRAMVTIWSDFLEGVANGKYKELTQEEAQKLFESGEKSEWQQFLEELRNKYKRLSSIYQQMSH